MTTVIFFFLWADQSFLGFQGSTFLEQMPRAAESLMLDGALRDGQPVNFNSDNNVKKSVVFWTKSKFTRGLFYSLIFILNCLIYCLFNRKSIMVSKSEDCKFWDRVKKKTTSSREIMNMKPCFKFEAQFSWNYRAAAGTS